MSLLVVPPMIWLLLGFQRRASPLFGQTQWRQGSLISILQENLTNARIVRVFGRQSHEEVRFGQAAQGYKGRLVESGTHDQLMAAGGLYANLVTQQAGGSLRVGIEALRLQAIPLFAHLDAPTLGGVANRLQLERFAAGEDVVRQGEFGDKLYIITRGQAEVVVAEDAGERRVNQLAEGDYFGELLLLSGDPRTATVRALTALELYTMSQADFTALLEREPSVRQVVAETAARRRAELLAQAPGARQPQEVATA